MLVDIEALPRPEHELSRDHRNRQARLGKRGADVRWHVVGALGVVCEQWITFWHKAAKEALEIRTRRPRLYVAATSAMTTWWNFVTR